MALGFGIGLSLIGLGVLCMLLFRLAAYALPAYAAVATGLYLHGHGAGLAGAIVLAILAGTMVLALGQIAFNARTLIIRLGAALVFAIPAAMAGYSVGHGLSGIGDTAETWQQMVGVISAVVTASTALVRLTLPVRMKTGPRPLPAQV